jgi:hypothetical protein
MRRAGFGIIASVMMVLSWAPQSFAMAKKLPAEGDRVPQAASTDDSVWVGKSDGGKSCDTEPAISLDTGAHELKGVEVKILSKKKLHDSKMRIQSCGADKGTLNGFLIPKNELEKAHRAGYDPIPDSYKN